LQKFLTLPLRKKRALHNPNPTPVECIVALPLTIVVATTTTTAKEHPKY